ncbi:MAG: CPBP family intramembrane metalloprotease [Spirochaetales bacterium]|nr:CPBP family intramembrane metalloprotease [Spirochaetales bacterium]
MNTFKFLIKRPILNYFIITFVFSWSGIIIVSFFTGIPAPSKTFESIAPIAMLPLVIGPTFVSLLLTASIYGKSGLKGLISRLFKWKLNIKWYIFALLTLPIIASITLLSLSQYSTDFLPDIITSENKIDLLITGLLVGIVLTLFEEIGWTGFAIPEMRKHYSVLTTGLLLGALWGAWHFLPLFYGCGDTSGKFDFQLFYPGLFFHYAGLIPFRILMTWLYEKTESILLPWIMHATLTSCIFFILNISKTGFPLFIYYIALSILLWTIVLLCFIWKKLKKQ